MSSKTKLRRLPTNHRVRILGLLVTSALLTLTPTVSNAANGSVIYTYDALGRISTASYDTGVIIIYTYDPNGNRTQQLINVNSGTLTWSTTVDPCTANCWGAGKW